MKFKKSVSLLMTGALLLSTLVIPTGAAAVIASGASALRPVAVSYDISGLSAVAAGDVIDQSRTYREYRTGDDVSSLGAYTAHNMVFDGGKSNGTMTYLSPNPLAYWTGNSEKSVAIDYDGYGPKNLDSADVSYIAYKIEYSGNISSFCLDIYGALAPSLDQDKNGGWAQIGVYLFSELPADQNGRIDFNEYSCFHCMGSKDQQPSYYAAPLSLLVDAETLWNADVTNTCYIVLACLASGGILESVDDRLSGYGGQGGAPVFRLSGITISAPIVEEHTHILQLVPKVDEKCGSDGNIAYYKCSQCDDCFRDSLGKEPIAKEQTVIPAPASEHKYNDTFFGPTEHADAYIEYRCEYCGDTYTKSVPTPTPVPFGDANGDYQLDSDDALLILNHVMRPDLFQLAWSADVNVNGDDVIDSDDALYLLNHVMRPDLYPLLRSWEVDQTK